MVRSLEDESFARSEDGWQEMWMAWFVCVVWCVVGGEKRGVESGGCGKQRDALRDRGREMMGGDRLLQLGGQ